MVDSSMADVCTHLDQIADDVTPGASGCRECRAGCCDSSKNRHATRHFRQPEHPCYVDEVVLSR